MPTSTSVLGKYLGRRKGGPIKMFELKPDFEKTMQRMEAFWQRDVLDHPLAQFPSVGKPPEKCVPLPPSHHATADDRWLDVDYQVALVNAQLTNSEFIGDTLPVAMPNLGPEIFSAFYGCPMHFSDYGTSWSDPILFDWAQADDLRLDWDNFYFKKMVAMTDAFLEAGKSKWITGMTDWHPGADGIAAFRDPQKLAVDMLEYPIEVKRLLGRINRDYFKVYDFYYEKLRAAGLPITSWTPLVADGKYYIPSNDFSIMVSKSMYDEFFLPGIQLECQFLDHSIYHLDGPGALRHLDSILSIPELDALQWVPGSGNEGFHRWVWVYQKVQKAGKGIQVNCSISDFDEIIETLNPCGLYLVFSDCPSRQTGEEIIKRLERWCKK
jgi:hypothetical protein